MRKHTFAPVRREVKNVVRSCVDQRRCRGAALRVAKTPPVHKRSQRAALRCIEHQLEAYNYSPLLFADAGCILGRKQWVGPLRMDAAVVLNLMNFRPVAQLVRALP
jgi:hypothetical protein